MSDMCRRYRMQRLSGKRRHVARKNLAQRIVRYNLMIVMVPVFLLMLFLLNASRERLVGFEKREAEAYRDQMHNNVCSNVTLMRALALTAMTDETLNASLNRDRLTQMDMLELKRETVDNMQNLRLANPSVSSVRFFFLKEGMAEIPPSVYAVSRLPEDARKHMEQQDTMWRLGRNDPIAEDRLTALHAFFYQKVYTLAGEDGGYIEIAMDMNDFLANMSRSDGKMLTGFRMNGGALYYRYAEADGETLWSSYIPELTRQMEGKQGQTLTRLGGRRLYLCWKQVEDLKGAIFCVRDITEIYRQDWRMMCVCGCALGAIFLLLMLTTRGFTRRLLYRMYLLIAAMRQVEDGDMQVRAQTGEEDEIDELAVHFNRMIDTLEMLMKTNQQRQLLAREAEVRALQSQINTHFLYNTLETIKMMAVIDGRRQIADAVNTLGCLLRYAVHLKSPMVTVREELQNIRDYLSLMALRRDGNVTLEICVEEAVQRQEMCKLSLQPILENALLHGACPSTLDVSIRVYANVSSDLRRYSLCVEDDGVGMTAEALEKLRETLERRPGQEEEPCSVGLYNVNNRIKLYFGEAYGLRVESEFQRFTKVWLDFPMQEMY